MISKVEAIQKLKKMGVIVADDHSIVTVLIPTGSSFEKGIKDIRAKFKEIGYDSSFCIKQTKGETASNNNDSEDETNASDAVNVIEYEKEDSIVKAQSEEISDEEAHSYLAVDTDDLFSMEDDGQFTLGNFGVEF